MFKVNPSSKPIVEIENRSMKILFELLKKEMSLEESIKRVVPLDTSVSMIAEQCNIKNEIEKMLMETVTSGREKESSAYAVYSLCACIIAGANTVLACLTENSEET